jgi:hypothetical protein
LPARPVPSMAFMLVRFVQHLEALRRESLGQLFVVRSAVRMLSA